MTLHSIHRPSNLLRRAVYLFAALGFIWMSSSAGAQDTGVNFNISYNQGGSETDYSMVIQILFIMTIVSLGPAIVLMMTSFLRITIVLSFLRNAMGLQTTPSNQVIVAISLFLTFFLMSPVIAVIQTEALEPYQAQEITSQVALDRSVNTLKQFMLNQTRPADLEFFLELSGAGRTGVADLPVSVVIPAFVLSELRTAFQMGFLIFLPFIVIDFLVASSLMAMGMFMMPPALVSLPFKILLFVLVDGWYLVIRSLVQSFQI